MIMQTLLDKWASQMAGSAHAAAASLSNLPHPVPEWVSDVYPWPYKTRRNPEQAPPTRMPLTIMCGGPGPFEEPFEQPNPLLELATKRLGSMWVLGRVPRAI